MKFSNCVEPKPLISTKDESQLAEYHYSWFRFFNLGGMIREIDRIETLLCNGYTSAISIHPLDKTTNNSITYWFFPDISNPTKKIEVKCSETNGTNEVLLEYTNPDTGDMYKEKKQILRMHDSVSEMIKDKDEKVKEKGKAWNRYTLAMKQYFTQGKVLSIDELYNDKYVSDKMMLPANARNFALLPPRNQKSWINARDKLLELLDKISPHQESFSQAPPD